MVLSVQCAERRRQAVPDVNRLLKQHLQMQKMMKKAAKGGMANMMRGLTGLGGGFRPG